MKKIVIDAAELQTWLHETWHLYASQFVDGKLLRLWTNGLIEYRVVYGDEVLYEGSQMTHAIAAWESA
jgi:hypothetical protein